MGKFKVDIHRQISGYVIIEADDTFHAFDKVENDEYDESEFITTKVIVETVMNSNEVKEVSPSK